MVHRYIIIIHIHMCMQSTLLCCYIVLHVEVKPKDVYTLDQCVYNYMNSSCTFANSQSNTTYCHGKATSIRIIYM